VLRETVRQECEERNELTEALESAKKELLLLKRPPSRHGLSRQHINSRFPQSIPSLLSTGPGMHYKSLQIYIKR